MSMQRLEKILDKALRKESLSGEDIVFILGLRREVELELLFKAAVELRSRYFRDRVFLYGFLYISTYCRNNCNFCFYRVSNSVSLRYRKGEDEIVAAAAALAESGVHLIDLTMGEDPVYFGMGSDSGEGFESFIRLVERVKGETGLPVMVSPGVVPEFVLGELAAVGATWFACYQETHNRGLFGRLRPGQDYDARFDIKRLAREYGLLTEEGILVGVGEEADDILLTLEAVRSLGVQQVRAMNFVPREGTPMGDFPEPDGLRELVMIALMRLVFPDRLIPATLDVEGLGGLKRRLGAGANVVTSIVPPRWGLAGVAQSVLDIDSSRRTTSSVIPVLEECGLKPATAEDYSSFINQKFLEVQEPFFKKVPARRRL